MQIRQIIVAEIVAVCGARRVVVAVGVGAGRGRRLRRVGRYHEGRQSNGLAIDGDLVGSSIR